jgi:hypothetical protein
MDKEQQQEKGILQTKINSKQNELKHLRSRKNVAVSLKQIYDEIVLNLGNKTDIEKREILSKYVYQILVDFDPIGAYHIIKVYFNLDLSLIPKVYSLPYREMGWEPIGYESEEGRIFKFSEGYTDSDLLPQSKL